MEQDAGRLEVLRRMRECEARGEFNIDIEDDPPTRQLDARKIDYLRKKISSKIKTRFYYFLGLRFIRKLLKTKQLIIKDVVGLENLKNFSGGAVITCNHINIMDNFIVLLGLDRHFKNLKKANKMYKIVREGNYSQTGMIGQCLRYCDTLPVDASGANWRLNAKSMEAVKVLLSRGKKVLIYPEQSMWWNYKKPRPQKIGAFAAAAKSAVPIIPCFITMKETDKIGADGFAVMEYTLHILPLIAPAEKEIMRAENEKLWAEVYERVYKC